MTSEGKRNSGWGRAELDRISRNVMAVHNDYVQQNRNELDGIGNRLQAVDARMAGLTRRSGNMRREIGDLRGNIEGMGGQVASLDRQVGAIGEDYLKHKDNYIKTLEKVGENEFLLERLGRTVDRYGKMAIGYRNLPDDVRDLGLQVQRAEGLGPRVSQLEARVGRLEARLLTERSLSGSAADGLSSQNRARKRQRAIETPIGPEMPNTPEEGAA